MDRDFHPALPSPLTPFRGSPLVDPPLPRLPDPHSPAFLPSSACPPLPSAEVPMQGTSDHNLQIENLKLQIQLEDAKRRRMEEERRLFDARTGRPAYSTTASAASQGQNEYDRPADFKAALLNIGYISHRTGFMEVVDILAAEYGFRLLQV